VLGFLGDIHHQGGEILVDIFLHRLAQRIHVDIAGLHHLAGVGVVHQGQEQVFQSGIFMMPVAGELDGLVQRLFQTPR
jgi:hypothetical protein